MAKEQDNTSPTAAPLQALTPEMLSAIAELMKASSDRGSSHELILKAIESMSASSKQMAKEYSRQTRAQNMEATGLSPFTFDPRCAICKAGGEHEDGKLTHPKPDLKYRTFFCHNRQFHDALTVLEVELFNSFTESKTARNGSWRADLGKDGNVSALAIHVPFVGLDARGELPSLVQILTELLFGDAVADPLTAAAEIQALHKRIAALEAERQPVGA